MNSIGLMTRRVRPRRGVFSKYAIRPSGRSSIRSSAKAGREQYRTSLSRADRRPPSSAAMRTAQCTSNPSHAAEKRRSRRSKAASGLSLCSKGRARIRSTRECELGTRIERGGLDGLVAALLGRAARRGNRGAVAKEAHARGRVAPQSRHRPLKAAAHRGSARPWRSSRKRRRLPACGNGRERSSSSRISEGTRPSPFVRLRCSRAAWSRGRSPPRRCAPSPRGRRTFWPRARAARTEAT